LLHVPTDLLRHSGPTNCIASSIVFKRCTWTTSVGKEPTSNVSAASMVSKENGSPAPNGTSRMHLKGDW
jgi:hypothetical protein